MPKGLQSTLLLEILEIGMKIGVFDEVLFKEYLAIPMAIYTNVFKSEKKACGDSHWNTYLYNV
jgi:hypothetical protein